MIIPYYSALPAPSMGRMHSWGSLRAKMRASSSRYRFHISVLESQPTSWSRRSTTSVLTLNSRASRRASSSGGSLVRSSGRSRSTGMRNSAATALHQRSNSMVCGDSGESQEGPGQSEGERARSCGRLGIGVGSWGA